MLMYEVQIGSGQTKSIDISGLKYNQVYQVLYTTNNGNWFSGSFYIVLSDIPIIADKKNFGISEFPISADFNAKTLNFTDQTEYGFGLNIKIIG